MRKSSIEELDRTFEKRHTSHRNQRLLMRSYRILMLLAFPVIVFVLGQECDSWIDYGLLAA